MGGSKNGQEGHCYWFMAVIDETLGLVLVSGLKYPRLSVSVS
jgi:hypothetical protein